MCQRNPNPQRGGAGRQETDRAVALPKRSVHPPSRTRVIVFQSKPSDNLGERLKATGDRRGQGGVGRPSSVRPGDLAVSSDQRRRPGRRPPKGHRGAGRRPRGLALPLSAASRTLALLPRSSTLSEV